MLILKIYQSELDQTAEHAGIFFATPTEKALIMLQKALHTVNQAGLDGKEITETTVIRKFEGTSTDSLYEIHGKVKHRLKQKPATT